MSRKFAQIHKANLHHGISEIPSKVDIIIRQDIFQWSFTAHFIQDGNMFCIDTRTNEKTEIRMFDISHFLHFPSESIGQFYVFFSDKFHHDIFAVPATCCL